MVLWTGTIRMGEERFMQKTKRDTEQRMNFSALSPWFGICLAQSGYTPTLFLVLAQSCTVGCGHGEKNLEILDFPNDM